MMKPSRLTVSSEMNLGITGDVTPLGLLGPRQVVTHSSHMNPVDVETPAEGKFSRPCPLNDASSPFPSYTYRMSYWPSVSKDWAVRVM